MKKIAAIFILIISLVGVSHVYANNISVTTIQGLPSQTQLNQSYNLRYQVTNNGATQGVFVFGFPLPNMTYQSGNCAPSGQVLPQGGSCFINLTFLPTTLGAYQHLFVVANAYGQIQVPLNTTVQPAPPATVAVSTNITDLPPGAAVTIGALGGGKTYSQQETNGVAPFANMLPNISYQISVPTYTESGLVCTGAVIPPSSNPMTITAQANTIYIKYSCMQVVPAVYTYITGLPTPTAAAQISMTGIQYHNSYQNSETNGSWQFASNVVTDSYNVTAAPYLDATQTCTGTVTNNPVPIDISHTDIKITYTCQQIPNYTVKDTIQSDDGSALPSGFSVTITMANESSHQSYTKTGVVSGANVVISQDGGVPAGTYDITGSNFVNGSDTYSTVGITGVKVENDVTLTQPIVYKKSSTPPVTGYLIGTITGLPSDAKVNLSIASADGKSYSDTNQVGNGVNENISSKPLADDAYIVTFDQSYTDPKTNNQYIGVPSKFWWVAVDATHNALPTAVQYFAVAPAFNVVVSGLSGASTITAYANGSQAAALPVNGSGMYPFKQVPETSVMFGAPEVATSSQACTATMPVNPVQVTGSTPNVVINYACSDLANELIYHFVFPYTSSQQTIDTTYLLGSDHTTLIMSNLVAGVLYGDMLLQTDPKLQFNKDYLYGSLYAQVVQESGITGYADPSASGMGYIDAPGYRSQLLGAGEGGPYQINDYAKRLADGRTDKGYGMINYVATQRALNFTVEDQDSGVQTGKQGPEILDNLYFGPIAAAYFQFNDFIRMGANSSSSTKAGWYQCITNIENGKFSNGSDQYMDMLMNALYNAGPNQDPTMRYIAICANPANSQAALAAMSDYTLDQDAYNQAIGADASGTFVLYPRQTRAYLDELFGSSNKGLPSTQINISFTMAQLQTVFANSMTTLGYTNAAQTTYTLITAAQANTAFTKALSDNGISVSTTIHLNNSNDRNKLYAVLEEALANLETTLKFHFSDTTEADLGQQKS